MNKLNIPTSFMGRDIREAYERVMNEKEPESPIVPIVNPTFQSNLDFWTIENVQYRNEIFKVDLLKTLLDNGNLKIQDEWSEYSKTAKQSGSFYVGDFPMYHSLFTSLFKLKDNPRIEEIRSFLQEQFKAKWLTTLTRINYNSKGNDKIIHHYKMLDEYSIQDSFVGPDECVKDSKNKTNYKSLLNSDNLQEINAVYNWITGKDAYLWRINSKPASLDERVAWFGAVSGGADLYCARSPSSQCSALGVRAAKQP
jgi:hypothetical protein